MGSRPFTTSALRRCILDEPPVRRQLGMVVGTRGSRLHSGVRRLGPSSRSLALNQRVFVTTIPKSVPSGEYLVRMEHIGLHQTGHPEVFMSCAQIKVVNGGTGKPPMVEIPGYLSKDDPSLIVDIYWPVPTSYEVPGPKPYRGQPDMCSIKSRA
ncbi:hypothetical protein FA13DRAFT_1466304 [Coprinellus micaceus]|uniref:lytic cellulose monooxygenase (C4-dehydrogenating) n=1 Tax=Coprinellus micaceus TaxID=71717 RepID=A0A4Y7SM13_COPMI|nr:hypothetical protein FA13DRAFT_1466304 [Coprinellus micaceus]